MTIDERLRKFLFMRGIPVGVEFSEKEVREYLRVILGAARNERAQQLFIENLLMMIIEHLSEKGG